MKCWALVFSKLKYRRVYLCVGKGYTSAHFTRPRHWEFYLRMLPKKQVSFFTPDGGGCVLKMADTVVYKRRGPRCGAETRPRGAARQTPAVRLLPGVRPRTCH